MVEGQIDAFFGGSGIDCSRSRGGDSCHSGFDLRRSSVKFRLLKQIGMDDLVLSRCFRGKFDPLLLLNDGVTRSFQSRKDKK